MLQEHIEIMRLPSKRDKRRKMKGADKRCRKRLTERQKTIVILTSASKMNLTD